jgi:peroxidase
MANGILLTRVAFLLLLGTVGVSVNGQLQFGYYSDECPGAEDIVTAVVQQAAASDGTILPALVRLQFHDCFVRVSIRAAAAWRSHGSSEGD